MDDQEGLIREVNEAMRQEKMKHFFSHFGRYIVMVSGAIILSTLSYVWWQSNITAGHEKATTRFYEAVKMVGDGKSYPAREAFSDIAKGDDASLAILAKLWLVKLKYEAGKPDKAAEMAEKILKETAHHTAWPQYRDWLTLYLPATDKHEDLLTKKSVYRLTNMERLASAKIREGKLDEATMIYKAIAEDNATPATMRERATLILGTALKAETPPKTAPEKTKEPSTQPAAGL